MNRIKSFITESSVQTLCTVEGLPVIIAGEHENLNYVVCGLKVFSSPYASEIGLTGAFPIFIRNIIQWAIPQLDNPLIYTMTVGETTRLAIGQEQIWDNSDFLNIYRRGRYIIISPENPGIFSWRRGEQELVLVANTPVSESDLCPRTLSSKKTNVKLTSTYHRKNYPLNKIFMLVLLVTLFVEWFIWRGGWRSPKKVY